MRYPVTPDGRYFMVRGRLWRMSDPALDPERRDTLVRDLMQARRAMGEARKAGDRAAGAAAKARSMPPSARLASAATPWWGDGAPDLNRHLARNTPYAEWAAAQRRARLAAVARTRVDRLDRRRRRRAAPALSSSIQSRNGRR